MKSRYIKPELEAFALQGPLNILFEASNGEASVGIVEWYEFDPVDSEDENP